MKQLNVQFNKYSWNNSKWNLVCLKQYMICILYDMHQKSKMLNLCEIKSWFNTNK